MPPGERRRVWREDWDKVLCRWPVMLVSFALLPILVGAMYLVGYLALAVRLGWSPLLLVSGLLARPTDSS